MPHLTAVSFPPKLAPVFHEAVEFYHFDNMNQFFRACAHSLIEHHKHKDTLTLPLTFLTAGEGDE